MGLFDPHVGNEPKSFDIVNGLNQSEFFKNEILQLALTRLIEVIGEAASHVDEQTREEFNSIPWHEIIGMRHRIVHDYLNVDEQVIWQVAHEDLPDLYTTLNKIIPQEYKTEFD